MARNEMNLQRELAEIGKMLTWLGEATGAFEFATVATVMRRVHVNEDGSETPVIDFYPAWTPGGYGKYKIAHEYLNHDWQVERFEKFSSIKLADLPLYNGQQALIRNPGRRDRAEVDLPQPFRLIVRTPPGLSEEDRQKAKKEILGYRRLPGYNSQPQPSRPAPPPPQEPDTSAAPQQPEPSGYKPIPAVMPDDVEHWTIEALSATEPLMFDTAILKLFPQFDNLENVEKSRESWFGESWNEEHAPAYFAGIRKLVQAMEAGTDRALARKLAVAEFENNVNAIRQTA